MIEKKYLNEFILTQNVVDKEKELLTSKKLYIILSEWGKQLSNSKDVRIQELHQNNLVYFERLNLDDYILEPLWYDLEELIKYDVLRPKAKNLQHAVDIVVNVLWELIAYKTDRVCKITPTFNLRLLTDKNKQNLYFSCDNCSYIEDIDGQQIKVGHKLFPAIKKQIMSNNISSG